MIHGQGIVEARGFCCRISAGKGAGRFALEWRSTYSPGAKFFELDHESVNLAGCVAVKKGIAANFFAKPISTARPESRAHQCCRGFFWNHRRPYLTEATRALMSATRHADVLGDNFTGFGKRPDLHPAHQADLDTGKIAKTCGSLRNPSDDIFCIALNPIKAKRPTMH